jgi:hypothetical protein
MKKWFMNQSILMFLLIALSVFLIASCSIMSPRTPQEKERWQLFTEMKQGNYRLLIDTLDVSKIEDGVTEGSFKCIAEITPAEKRIQAIRKTVREANSEAGLAQDRDEQVVKGLIANETKLHDCEISCKNDMLYFYLHKQHILEFPVSASGPDRDIFNKVCK